MIRSGRTRKRWYMPARYGAAVRSEGSRWRSSTRLEREEAEELRHAIMYSKGDGVGTRASRDRHADTRVTVLLSI